MTFALSSVDQLYYTVAPVTTHAYTLRREISKRVLKKASGFFYRNQSNSKLFLITNRHVIQEGNYQANALRLMLHTDHNDMSQNDYYDIHLYNGTKPNWRQSNLVTADVIAIEIDDQGILNRGFILTSFASNNMLPQNYVLTVADGVFVMGYPLGVYDQRNNLPTVRGGTVASAYPIPWNNYPYFLIDSDLEEGTSGSPVVTNFKSLWMTQTGPVIETGLSIYLLGVNSSTFPIPRRRKKPFGLNAVYFVQVIEQITT